MRIVTDPLGLRLKKILGFCVLTAHKIVGWWQG